MHYINRIAFNLFVSVFLAIGSSAFLSAAQYGKLIIEVRVYKISEGKMDEWERFFHDKLVPPQEKAGMKITSAYRSIEDDNLYVWTRQYSSKANMAKERDGFYKSDEWLNTLLPELREKGFIEGIEKVYTLAVSK